MNPRSVTPQVVGRPPGFGLRRSSVAVARNCGVGKRPRTAARHEAVAPEWARRPGRIVGLTGGRHVVP
jgi:hypothetical protein